MRGPKTLGIKIYNSLGSKLVSSKEATGVGLLIIDDPDLGRICLEWSQLLGTLARGDNKAKTELVSETLQDLTKYNEIKLVTYQSCTNVQLCPYQSY